MTITYRSVTRYCAARSASLGSDLVFGFQTSCDGGTWGFDEHRFVELEHPSGSFRGRKDLCPVALSYGSSSGILVAGRENRGGFVSCWACLLR
jgi:hypothetical protein